MTYLQYYGLAQHDQQDPWLRHCRTELFSVAGNLLLYHILLDIVQSIYQNKDHFDKSKINPNSELNQNKTFYAKRLVRNPDFSNLDLKIPNWQLCYPPLGVT